MCKNRSKFGECTANIAVALVVLFSGITFCFLHELWGKHLKPGNELYEFGSVFLVVKLLSLSEYCLKDSSKTNIDALKEFVDANSCEYDLCRLPPIMYVFCRINPLCFVHSR